MRVLGAHDIVLALPMTEAVQAASEAMRALGLGEIRVPERSQLAVGDGTQLVMTAVWEGRGVSSTKLISVNPVNPSRGHPTSYGLIALLETPTGRPLALIEAAQLTALRTSALCAVATDLLAARRISVAAILGSGRHARAQLEALLTVRQPERVWIHSRNPEHASRYVEEMSSSPRLISGVELLAAGSVEEAVRGAQVISCATSSPQPLFDGNLVRPGAHVNAIGAFTPNTRELDTELIARSTVFMDTRAGCLEEAGDLLIPLREGRLRDEALGTEIGDILLGRATGRRSEKEITVFKSVGTAALDVAAAARALRGAEAANLGTELDLA